jgi:hypothetical protein
MRRALVIIFGFRLGFWKQMLIFQSIDETNQGIYINGIRFKL